MNKIEFNAMMEEIDEVLRSKGILIPHRPLWAVMEVSNRLKIKILAFSPGTKRIAGQYDTITLGEHINDWYISRYGNRLKLHLGPGSIAIIIKGEPWRLFIPRIYGTIDIYCDPDMKKHQCAPNIVVGKEPVICNVLNCIENFPEGMASILTMDERKQILIFFINSKNCLEGLEKILDIPYVNEAKVDLESSVAYIFTNPPEYGLSKWSSLQFIEKLIKSYLALKNEPVPRHHNLAEIANGAYNVGLQSLDSSLLERVQCSAGVRYGEIAVTLKEAISSHYAALTLSIKLIEDISKFK